MDQLIVSRASLNDLETIKLIGRETFFETFAESNTEADMKKYLDESFNDAKLTAELNDQNSHFFISWEEKKPIGYMKLNVGTAQTEIRDDLSIEIERIYVKQAYHGKKVGQVLYDKALEIARQMKKKYIWLGVWEENPKAIRFYEKNGFVPFDKHVFRVGEDEQTDIMMKKEL